MSRSGHARQSGSDLQATVRVTPTTAWPRVHSWTWRALPHLLAITPAASPLQYTILYTVRITGLPVTALQQLSSGLSTLVSAALKAALPGATVTATSLQLLVPSASSSV